MRRRLAVGALTGLVAVVAAGAHASTLPPLHSEDTSSHPAGAVRTLVVDADLSTVTLVPGPASTVTAHLEWALQRPELTVGLSRGVLTVRARCRDSVMAGSAYVSMAGFCADDLRIVVPAGTDLSIVTGNAVVARGFTGRVDVTTGSADLSDLRSPRVRLHADFDATVRNTTAPLLDVTSATGAVTASGVTARSLSLSSDTGAVSADVVTATSLALSSSSGSVTLRRATSPVATLQSQNGSVTVKDSTVDRLSATSSTGGVSVGLTRTPRLVETSSDNGAVAVTVPRGRYAVETHSDNGTVRVSGITVDRRAGHRITARSSTSDVTVTGV